MKHAWMVILVATGVAQAQPRATPGVRGESTQTAKRLVEAAEKLKTNRPAEAIVDLQKILDEAGDDLVPVTANTLAPARIFVHQQLAVLPKDHLQTYRDRIDGPSKVLFEKAKRDRDPRPLVQLFDKYFVSSITPQAQDLYGDFCFERGEFALAERAYLQAVAVNPFAIHSKRILVIHARGETDRAKAELVALRKEFPSELPAIEKLQQRLNTPAPALPETDPTWTTLGGNAARTGRASVPLPHRLPFVPSWSTLIPRPEVVNETPFGSRPRSPATHPVVFRGRVYFADAARVMTLNPETGKAGVIFDLREVEDIADAASVSTADMELPNRFDADYTLTVADDKIFARLGTPGVRGMGLVEGPEIRERKPASVIVRLGRNFSAPDSPLMQVDLTLKPPSVGALWEGAPVVRGPNLWAMFSKVEGDKVTLSVAQYWLANADKPMWVKEVMNVPSSDAFTIRHRHELLSLSGDTLIVSGNGGAAVALDAVTGATRWAFTYARPKPGAFDFRYRGISPAVIYDGRVILAPTDAEGVYALDIVTGELLWQSAPIRATNVLGISQGKVIVAVASPMRGLRAWDIKTGSDETPKGWANHDDPDLATLGRGLVSDDVILWPTTSGLYLMNPTDGSVLGPPTAGPQGNITVLPGLVVVATGREIYGYRFEPPPTGTKPPSASPGIILTKTDSVPAPAVVKVAIDLPPQAPTRLIKTMPLKLSNSIDGIPLMADPLVIGLPTGGLLVGPREKSKVLPLGFQATEVLQEYQDGSVLLAGREGIARVALNTQKMMWATSCPGREFNGFHAMEGIAVCRAGDYHLYAFDIETGNLLWKMDSRLRPHYTEYLVETSPRFSPFPLCTGRTITAHLTNGVWVRIDARTGQVLFTTKNHPATWPTMAISTTNETVVAPNGPDCVEARNNTATRPVWVFRAKGEASLTGEAPQIRAFTKRILVAFRRTFGFELHLLNDETGKPVWGKSGTIILAQHLNVQQMDSNGETIAVTHDDALTLIREADGDILWRVAMPNSGGATNWVARMGTQGIVVWPSQAIAVEPLAVVAPRVLLSFMQSPMACRVVGLAFTLYESLMDRRITLLTLNVTTGKEILHLVLPAAGPWVKVNLTAGAKPIVLTSTAIYTFE